MYTRILVSAVLATAACSSSSGRSANGPPSLPVTSGSDTLTIAVGTEVSTRDRGLAVTFVRQVSESRCPANVVCVWQGDAAVRLKAVSRNGTVEATLHTELEPKTLEVGGYRISVLDVQPYPGAGDSARTSRVVVQVVRND